MVTRNETFDQPLSPIECCRPLGASQLSEEEGQAMAAVFKALADPARVKIVNLLATSDEPVCVCDFVPALGLGQPTVSHHLRKLVDAGLLERRRRGKWAYFSLDRQAVKRLVNLVDTSQVVA